MPLCVDSLALPVSGPRLFFDSWTAVQVVVVVVVQVELVSCSRLMLLSFVRQFCDASLPLRSSISLSMFLSLYEFGSDSMSMSTETNCS